MRLLPLLLCVACSSLPARSSKATAAAEHYAAALYPGVKAGVLCDTVDSDGNGKVRCTISLANPNGTFTKDIVECPSNWTPQWSSECVAPLMGVGRPPGM
jgi:hypothetical protein